ncbi:MAG TPA: ATP-binding protein, partial [Acidimicrobiales bacterium]
IIDDLLDLSRIESEEAPPREPVLVNLVMADAIERVRAAADQRGITITLSEPHPPVAVLGDRRQLVSAMHALLENAVTYSYDGTAVTVSGTVVSEGLDIAEPLAAVATVSPAATATIGSGQLSLGLGLPPAPTPEPADPIGLGGPGADADPLAEPDVDAGRTGESGGFAARPGGWVSPAAAAGSVEAGPTGNGISTDGRATSVDGEPASLGGPEPAARPVARETVRLAVADHGVGIPARDLDRIFERFYRVDHGRSRDTGGTGLGLSIVRHVANNHQGWVDVESREGEGSTFTLVLPLQPERMS